MVGHRSKGLCWVHTDQGLERFKENGGRKKAQKTQKRIGHFPSGFCAICAFLRLQLKAMQFLKTL
jgi:hypothetical protein